MSTMTVRRCRSCPRALKRNETDQCNDCKCVDASLRGYVHDRGPLREYPILSVEELPPGALCTWCQQTNGPDRAEPMYVHDDGTPGVRWYGHVSCEAQREYDKYEEWRDTQDWPE